MKKNNLLNGKALSEKILLDIRKEVFARTDKPGLAAILVGEDPSSHLYVKLKKQACEACDIDFHRYLFDEDSKTKDIIETINFLNADPEVNGILVQLPLPKGFDTDKIIAAIDPKKDVDGFHPANLKKLKQCSTKIVSPLVLGIVELIKSTKEIIKNKKIVILCNHEVFGKPFHCFYGQDNEIAIVTLKNKNHEEIIRHADILIVSIGKAKFITADMVKEGVIIIDVGINKVNDKVIGDVDFDTVKEKAKFITPVPGGVGPMTVAMLLHNLIQL